MRSKELLNRVLEELIRDSIIKECKLLGFKKKVLDNLELIFEKEVKIEGQLVSLIIDPYYSNISAYIVKNEEWVELLDECLITYNEHDFIDGRNNISYIVYPVLTRKVIEYNNNITS